MSAVADAKEMMGQTADFAGGAAIQLAVSKIAVSPTNARFVASMDREFIEDIRTKGILIPLLVRPLVKKGKNGEVWELIAGHRRLAAAREVGLEYVPCIAREATDQEAVSFQIVENLQRQNLHPLEEAQAFEVLLRQGKDVAAITKLVNRTVAYVYDRLQLLHLVEEGRELFLDGAFSTQHAILISRLGADRQKQLLRKKADGTHGPLWQLEKGLNQMTLAEERRSLKPISVRELQAWIEDHVRFSPDQPAPPELFEVTRLKIAEAEKKSTKVIPITEDHYVQVEAKSKTGERTYGPQSWRPATKPCPETVLGVVVAGPGWGKAFPICIMKKTCKLHWGEEIRDRQKADKRAAKGSVKDARELQAKRQEEYGKQRQRQEQERRRWKAAQSALFSALFEAMEKPVHLPKVIQYLATCYRPNYDIPSVTIPKPGSTPASLIHRFMAIEIADSLYEWNAAERAPKLGKMFGVDVKAIVDKVSPLEASEQPTPKPKRSPKKK